MAASLLVIGVVLFSTCNAATFNVEFNNWNSGCSNCQEMDERRKPRAGLIPQALSSEDSQGLPYLYGPNHVQQQGRSIATEAVFLWGAFYKPMRADLETPIAMRAQFYYWVTQSCVMAATKKGGMLSRIPNVAGNGDITYSVPSYKLSDANIDDLDGDDELEIFRAKAALVALYRLTQVSLARQFAGDPRMERMTEFFRQLAKPGLERDLDEILNRGWGTADALVVDVWDTDMGSINDRTPAYVGDGVGDQLDGFYCNDGWNACGTDRGTGQNGIEYYYADVTGFTPRHIANHGGNSQLWAPLFECHVGFCWKQEHVTPHIGYTAMSYFLNENDRQEVLEDPGMQRSTTLDYEAELNKILDEMKSVADDQQYKTLISYYDNKFNVADALAIAYEEPTMKYEDLVYSAMAYLSVEYEGVIINWAAKVRNNHVRPTTVAQEVLGSDQIENWVLGREGTETYPANQWVPYIRVMPHSEFPSGSACLCSAAADMSAHFLGLSSMNDAFPFDVTMAAGSNTVEPRLPESDWVKSWGSLLDLAEECTQSRFKGGMHFENSLDPGFEMCSSYRFDSNSYSFTEKAIAYNKWQWTGDESFLNGIGSPGDFGFRGNRNFVSPSADANCPNFNES